MGNTEKPCALGMPHEDCPNVQVATVGMTRKDRRLGWVWVAIIVVGYFISALWTSMTLQSWASLEIAEFAAPKEAVR